jgi:hypothetical protein
MPPGAIIAAIRLRAMPFQKSGTWWRALREKTYLVGSPACS